MTLDDYLSREKKNGVTEASFGLSVGLSQPSVNRLRSGKITPSIGTVQKIDRLTKGRVSLRDWPMEPAE